MKKVKFQDIIIFENEDYIAVNKPPYLSTLADRHENVNLLKLAKSYSEDAQVCHRIDKDTSGALVLAKNPEAYRSLSIQFERRTVTKEYHAVVDGIHNFIKEKVDKPLLVSGSGHVRIDNKEGKDATTYFETIKAYKKHTLVQCIPITGRMHQIRVHLASLGAPITGDNFYGGRPFLLSDVKKGYNLKKWTEETSLIGRFALHAHSITFELLSGQKTTIEADYPKDFRVLVDQLNKNC